MKKMNVALFLSVFALFIFGWQINVSFFDNGIVIASEADDEKVTDNVCGMQIDKAGAQVVDIKGKSFYFCSDQCKAKFSENPGKFACLCSIELEPGDEPCDCKHCSGEGGKCDCAEHHGHHDHEHEGDEH